MEVVVKMEGTRQQDPSAVFTGSTSDSWETLLLGRFAMVCRDSKTHKAKQVPPLLVETEEERMLWGISESKLTVEMSLMVRS